MPPEGVARCRAAWARFVGSLTCVVHGNPTNPDNVRVTANRVALVERDESHVDVPDLDLALPHNAAGLDEGAYETAAQASAAWGMPPSAGTTRTLCSGLPKFERSEQRQRTEDRVGSHEHVVRDSKGRFANGRNGSPLLVSLDHKGRRELVKNRNRVRHPARLADNDF
jgi:hypothetical protein